MQIIIDIPQLLDSCGLEVQEDRLLIVREKMEEFAFSYLMEYAEDIVQASGARYTKTDNTITVMDMTQEDCRAWLIRHDKEGARLYASMPATTDFRDIVNQNLRDFGDFGDLRHVPDYKPEGGAA